MHVGSASASQAVHGRRRTVVPMLERLPRPVRRAYTLGTATYHEWRMHRTIRLGAGIAYYGLFALVPILALSLAVAGLVVSDAEVQAYLDGRLVEVFGPRGRRLLLGDRVGARRLRNDRRARD